MASDIYARWLAREIDIYNMVQHHRPPSTPPMTREALEEAERQGGRGETQRYPHECTCNFTIWSTRTSHAPDCALMRQGGTTPQEKP